MAGGDESRETILREGWGPDSRVGEVCEDRRTSGWLGEYNRTGTGRFWGLLSVTGEDEDEGTRGSSRHEVGSGGFRRWGPDGLGVADGSGGDTRT